VIPLQMLAALLGWLDREQRDVIAFLRDENRALKTQLGPPPTAIGGARTADGVLSENCVGGFGYRKIDGEEMGVACLLPRSTNVRVFSSTTARRW
jgi:hypothetical protein